MAGLAENPDALIAPDAPPLGPASRHVPNARELAAIDKTLRESLARNIRSAVLAFSLAKIAGLQADDHARGEAVRLDNDSVHAPAKPWQTFDNLIADEPDKSVKQPITITNDVKMGLAVLFTRAADLINEVGKPPRGVDPLEHLAGAPWREAKIVQFMRSAVASARHLLRADPLCRNLEYDQGFRLKLEGLVASKALITPGADSISQLFLDFIKVVAWHAAVRAYEQEHLTLNRITFYSILASMEAGLPPADAPVVRHVLSLVRAQVETWGVAVAAAKKPAAAKKRAAAKAKQPPATEADAADPEAEAADPEPDADVDADADPDVDVDSESEPEVMPAKAAPAKAAPAKAAPAKVAPAKAAPAKAAPAKVAPAKAAPAKVAPAKAAPAMASELNYDSLLEDLGATAKDVGAPQ
jgi:cell division protein FtsN